MFEKKFLFNNIFKFFKNFKKKKYNLNKNLFIFFFKNKNIIIKKISFFYFLKKNKNNKFIKNSIYKFFLIFNYFLKKINKIFKIIIFKFPNLTHYLINNKNKILKTKKYKIKNFKINKKIFNKNLSKKTSGKGFCFIYQPYSYIYKILEDFMINKHIFEHNYKYIIVPEIMNFKSLINSCQLPKFIKKLFVIKNFNKIKYLIPTGEVSLINFMIKKNLYSNFLPLKFLTLTNCYRNEKIPYGLKSSSIIRQKQFKKIELIQISDVFNSYRLLKELVKHVEKILRIFKINYRIIELSRNEISYISSKTFDIEIWIPSINNYCEISSCSNTEIYQSFRSKIKYFYKLKKENVHIINGSGVALGRLFLSLLENYKIKDSINFLNFVKKFKI